MKHYYKFPPVQMADEFGIIGVSHDINLDLMESAYLQGIFPWPQEITEGALIPWFAPDPRAIFDLDHFYLSRSWARSIKSQRWQIKINVDFEQIVGACGDQSRRIETWISEELTKIYVGLFQNKKAYCVGVYLEEKLVGGIFGIHLHYFHSAESMFYEISGASKVALGALLAILKDLGISWLDSQVLSPATANLGVKEISRVQFMEKLQRSLAVKSDLNLENWGKINQKLLSNPEQLQGFIIDKLST
jgi:leucyl/phenylalanyl-tRNA--protein transferase